MKQILFSVLALGAMTGAALAEPQTMSEAQLEDVAGGASSIFTQNNSLTQSTFVMALSGGEVPAVATGGNTATQTLTGVSTATSTPMVMPSTPMALLSPTLPEGIGVPVP